MHDVFISYAKANGNVADAICHTLERRGVRCWYAPRDIEPGKSWSAAIIDGIDGARVMIVVLSQHSNGSVHVRNEIERAVHRGRIIIPVRIENVEPSKDLELFLSSHHWLDAMTPPIEQHLESLADTITQHLGTAEEPAAKTPPPPRPPPPPPASRKSNRAGKLTAVLLLLAACAAAWYFGRDLFEPPGDKVTAADLVSLRALVRGTAEKLAENPHAEHEHIVRLRDRAETARAEAERLEGLGDYAPASTQLEQALTTLREALVACDALDGRPRIEPPSSTSKMVAEAHRELETLLREGDQCLLDGDPDGALERFGAVAKRWTEVAEMDRESGEAEPALRKCEKLLKDPVFDVELGIWADHWNAMRERARRLAGEARASYESGDFAPARAKSEEAHKVAWEYIRGAGPAKRLAERLDAIDLDWKGAVYAAVAEEKQACEETREGLWAELVKGQLPTDGVAILEEAAKTLRERHDRARAEAENAFRNAVTSTGPAYEEAKKAYGEGRYDEAVQLLAKLRTPRTDLKKDLALAEQWVRDLPSPLAASAGKAASVARRALEAAGAAYQRNDAEGVAREVGAVKQAVSDATRQHRAAVDEYKKAQGRYEGVLRRLGMKPTADTRAAEGMAKRGDYLRAARVYAAAAEKIEKGEPEPAPDKRLAELWGNCVRAYKRLPRPCTPSRAKDAAVRAYNDAARAYRSGDQMGLARSTAAVEQAVADATRLHHIAVEEYKKAQSRYVAVLRRLGLKPTEDARTAEELAKRGEYHKAARVYAAAAEKLEKGAKPSPIKPIPIKPVPIRPTVKTPFRVGTVYYGGLLLQAGGRRTRSVPILLHFRGAKGNHWYVTFVELGPPPVRASLQGVWTGKSLTLHGKTRRGDVKVALSPGRAGTLAGTAVRGRSNYRISLRTVPHGVPRTMGRRYDGELSTGARISIGFGTGRTSATTNTGSAQGTLTITQGRDRARATFRGTLYGSYLLGSWKRADGQKVWLEGSFWVRIDDATMSGRWTSGRQSGSLKLKRGR